MFVYLIRINMIMIHNLDIAHDFIFKICCQFYSNFVIVNITLQICIYDIFF